MLRRLKRDADGGLTLIIQNEPPARIRAFAITSATPDARTPRARQGRKGSQWGGRLNTKITPAVEFLNCQGY
jgi:hypothetical protein